jgi:DNA-binding transcriptional ArsR family regulator
MSRTSSKATPADRRPVSRTGDRTKTGDERAFDWAALVPLLVHPLRVAIIEALVWIGKPLSATDLTKVFDNRFALVNVSYHLQELAKGGVVKRTRSRQVRGVVEKFYGLSGRMLAPPSAQTESA